jgi:hypothetical protein
MQEQPLERPQRAAPDQLVAPDHEAPAGLEAHRGRRELRVADELDLAGIGHPEPALVTHPEIRNLQRVETHDLRGDRVDRDLVGGRQDQVPHARHHRARSGAVTHHGAVHHREDCGMQFALHVHEVDEDLVHELVRVVAHLFQEAAERVLDRAGRCRVAVDLHRGRMKDILADVQLRNLDALGEDRVQPQQWRLELIDGPLDVRQRDERHAVPLEHRPPLVVATAGDRVGDDRLVLDREDPLTVVAVGGEGLQNPVDLPGLARARRKVLGPREVELEDQILVPGQDRVVLHQAHQAPVVLDDGLRACAKERDRARHDEAILL